MPSTQDSVSTPSEAQTPPTATTTAPSSPPNMADETPAMSTIMTDEEAKKMEELEKQAHDQNLKEQRKSIAAQKRMAAKRKNALSKEEAEIKAKQLDELLSKSEAFSSILKGKTQALGRVGTDMDGKALGEHDLAMATQPKIMTGGTMRDYQLEGLTWMYEICLQGMSGILADEMGLGKTIQTIGLIAKLREDGWNGPHLIAAPLSTLSNWISEFRKWCPSVPVVLYHGDPATR